MTHATLWSGLAIACLAVACAATSPAHADANVAPRANQSVDFDIGQDAIRTQDWPTAIQHLLLVARDEPANADAQNLLGFAYRNQKNYDAAFRHYREALRLDPQHRGAQEYIGEAYLLVGDKAKAREHLAALERICGKSCEEYENLARAIARAK